ncbi:hypothetical protein [Bacillus cereus]|uniref:hypothetical protein n=1 Tax=Bacillus cereus TaxID=1396 RepID=UPI000B4A7607|nr:hypothetical protein [Bacillus cereus]
MDLLLRQKYEETLKLNLKDKITNLEDLLVSCKQHKNAKLTYVVQFELMESYKIKGETYKAIQMYLNNIDLHIENRFDVKILLEHFPWVSTYIDSISSITQSEINNFFIKMENVFEYSIYSHRSYYQELYRYQLRVGNWNDAFETYTKWIVESRDAASQSMALEESERAIYYFLVGDNHNAKYIFNSVEKGIEGASGAKAFLFPRSARYYLELKEWEMAAYLIRRGYDFNKYKSDSLEELTEIMKILAVLNPKICLKIWKKHRYHINKSENERAHFSLGIAAQLIENSLCRLLIHSKNGDKLKVDIENMRRLQNAFDSRNQTSSYADEVEYWSNTWLRFNKNR